MRTVVDEKVLDIGENLVHHLQSHVSDYSGIFDHVCQAALHQLGMAHLACTHNMKEHINLRTLQLFIQYSQKVPHYGNVHRICQRLRLQYESSQFKPLSLLL